MSKSQTAKKAPTKSSKKKAVEVLDPRQAAFLRGYTDPASPTFSNARQSALAAGFSAKYADNITVIMPEWLGGFMGDDGAKLAKVERNLHKFLDLPTEEQMIGPTGPVFEDPEKTKPKVIQNPRFLEIQQKATFFVAERLNRAKYGKDDKVNIGFHFSIKPVKDRYLIED